MSAVRVFRGVWVLELESVLVVDPTFMVLGAFLSMFFAFGVEALVAATCYFHFQVDGVEATEGAEIVFVDCIVGFHVVCLELRF